MRSSVSDNGATAGVLFMAKASRYVNDCLAAEACFLRLVHPGCDRDRRISAPEGKENRKQKKLDTCPIPPPNRNREIEESR